MTSNYRGEAPYLVLHPYRTAERRELASFMESQQIRKVSGLFKGCPGPKSDLPFSSFGGFGSGWHIFCKDST